MTQATFYLNPQSVQACVPPKVFEAGKNLYLKQQVREVELRLASSRDGEIEGQVQGQARNPYWVTVRLEINPVGNLSALHGDCTCPAAHNCQHAVALTLKAAYRSARPGPAALVGTATALMPSAPATAPRTALLGDRLTPPDAPAPVPLAAPSPAPWPEVGKAAPTLAPDDALAQARERASAKFHQWLDGLADLQVPPTPSETAAPDEQVVYTLGPSTAPGGTVLELGCGLASPLQRGGWGKLRPLRYADSHNCGAQDLEIIALIRALSSAQGLHSNGPCELKGTTGQLALQLAAGSGRLLALVDERLYPTPLREGKPRGLNWHWRETATPRLREISWTLNARLQGEQDAQRDAPAPVSSRIEMEGCCGANQPPLYLDPANARFGHIEVPGMDTAQVLRLLQAPALPQSALEKSEPRLLQLLAGLPLPPPLRAPETLTAQPLAWQLQIAPVPAAQRAALGLLSATLRFGYGEIAFFSTTRQSPFFLELPGTPPASAPRRVWLPRALDAEQQALNALQSLGLRSFADGQFHLALQADQQQWLLWADSDFAALREAGFQVRVDAALKHWIARADALQVGLNGHEEDAADDGQAHQDAADARSAGNEKNTWFDLSLGYVIDGQRHNILPLLPALLHQLHAYSLGQGSLLQLPAHIYVPQADGFSHLRLPTAPLKPWLQALLELVGEQQLDGANLRLSQLQALRMGAALEAGAGAQADWAGATRLQAMVRQLRGQTPLAEVALPAGLRATLRPYQQQGLNWLQFLRQHGLNGILADDMGLGKTVQTLGHILLEKEQGRLDRPALIVAPVSLMGNWRREAARFAPQLKVLVLHGAERHEAAVGIARHDVVLVPYSLLQRDRARWLEQPWHIVVLDEAQNIKNVQSNAAQVVGQLQTRHRLCLSGTPMENHLGELWSLFQFLMPGFLGTQARFRDLFRLPIERDGNSERQEQLRRRITPFMLRRTKASVATDLPAKIVSVSTVELQDGQANLYETIRLSTEQSVRAALTDKGLARSQIQILDALLKLRQVCCDPRLLSLEAARGVTQSAKLEWLMETLPQMLSEGRRVLLFSQFTGMLALIEEALRERGLPWVKLTGQSTQRDALIERFTSGAVPLFLISLKAGGVGLDLPQADTVIHYDPWWNPAAENQATDRAHRIGQTQQLMVYKLVALGTIEERILALQERKAALAEGIYSGTTAKREALFNEDDVAELLKPLG